MIEDKRSIDALEHMLECINQTVAFVDGLEFEDFGNDIVIQRAVTMNMAIIGEMASSLRRRNPALVAQHQEIPW